MKFLVRADKEREHYVKLGILILKHRTDTNRKTTTRKEILLKKNSCETPRNLFFH